MINWGIIPISGVKPNADGWGRYECYTSYENRKFVNQIVFRQKCFQYVFICGGSEFINTICKCLYDQTKPYSVLTGHERIKEVERIVNEIETNSYCVIRLSASVFQNNKDLLYNRFKRFNKLQII